MKQKITFLLLFVLALGVVTMVLAQDESITITTYYPSPYGVYNTLRLYPNNEIVPNASCSNEGELHYDISEHTLYVCSGTPAQWRSAMSVGYTKGGVYGFCEELAQGYGLCPGGFYDDCPQNISCRKINYSTIVIPPSTCERDGTYSCHCPSGLTKLLIETTYVQTGEGLMVSGRRYSCIKKD